MFRFSGRRKALELDPFGNLDFGHEGFDVLLQNNWPRLEALYARQSASDRYIWIVTMAEHIPLDHPLSEVPHTAAAQTIMGGLKVGMAARFRGAGLANTVSDEAAQLMFSASDDAYESLYRAESLAPEDSVPIALHIRAAIAASDASDRVYNLVEKMHLTTETTLFAPLNYLSHQLGKWMGSQDEMWRIAEHYTQDPPNPCWYGLKAYAFIEDWLWYTVFEDDKQAKKAYSDRRFDGPLKQDIAALDDAFWTAMNTHQGSVPASELNFAHNYFAALNIQLGDRQASRPHLEAVGQFPSSMPWGYLRGPNENLMSYLNKQREKVGLPGYYA